MRALMLDGEWNPRPGYRLTSEEAEGRWAREARQVWRNPRWELRDVAAPGPVGAQDVLIRVRAAGIAVSTLRMTTTDDEGYVLLPYRMALPVIPGHEFSGEVVETGSGVDGFEVGEPVAVESLRPCGRCAACSTGHASACHLGAFAGFTQHGGLAEYAVVPAARLKSLGSLAKLHGMDAGEVCELGVVSEPAAIAYVGMFLADKHLRPGMRVAVIGAGPIGQAAVALARCAGATTICAFDLSERRRDIALALGADVVSSGNDSAGSIASVVAESTRGLGADLIIDATGDAASVLAEAQGALAVGGHILQLGVGGSAAPMNSMSTMVRGATHTFSMGHLGGFGPVIDLQASGRLDLRPMIGRRSGLEDVLSVLADSGEQRGGKDLILM